LRVGSDDTRAPTTHARLLGDRYRLGALLGRGGAGRVHEALDIVLGRPVAVKVYQASDNAAGRYRFAAEARLLAGLSHPGLVTVYDVGLDADESFLVMRLVEGPTLRELLDRGPFEPSAAARVGTQLAGALAYIHARDVVHRDIKPSNVLVDAAGACHLTDFGLARALSAAHLTFSGEFVGTAAYVAPEQITDVDIGPPADIYALGLLLLECLTGRTEYTGTTVETALARLTRPPRIPDTLSSAWQTLLNAMTAQDPGSRPDAAHCAETLDAITEERVVPHPPATRPRPVPDDSPDRPYPVTSKLRRPRRGAVHAGLTAAALAAAAAYVVAVAPTTAIPGRPTGLPHEQRTPNTAETETVTESVQPSLPTTAQPPTTTNPDDSPPATGSPNTTPPTTQTTPAPTTTNPNKANGKQDNNGAGKTNNKNGKN
jgi:eukaryotic-like serine/threonine-protein kinase